MCVAETHTRGVVFHPSTRTYYKHNARAGLPILVAARDTGAGEAVLSVPDSQWLSPQAVSKSVLGPHVAGMEPWVQLALLLVHERFVSASPAWGPYVASLPLKPSTPLFWTEEQSSMLQGTQMMESLQGYRCVYSCASLV